MHESSTQDPCRQLIEQFRSVPAETWNRGTAADLRETLEELGIDLDSNELENREVDTGIRILGRVAHEYDESSFREALETGELPPVEMSDREMQVVRGGNDTVRDVAEWLLEQWNDMHGDERGTV